jgi:hypothetical protein
VTDFDFSDETLRSGVVSPEEAQRLGIKGTSDDDPSGHALAEAAYAAGVVEPAASLPLHHCELRFVVHGSQEHVDRVLLELSAELMARADVNRVGAAVIPEAELTP